MTKPKKKSMLPTISQEAVVFIDATPNEDYPLRILRTYRENCNCMWASELDHPLIKAMNEAQNKRAEVLDKAIKKLELK